jgi:uncharacterized protein YbjT (DUF2867 family)
MSVILVTGSTGTVGSRIVQMLAAGPHRVRALARRDPSTLPGGVEVVRGDLADRASLRAAAEGVSTVYLLTSGPDLQQHDANLIAAALEAGVGHVVKHSVGGAEHERGTIAKWHRAGERSLEQSSMGWTHIRPSSFASNALGWIGSIKGTGKVFGALGDAAMPVIDPEDISAVAARILADPAPHAGQAYVITGPEAVTTAQQVQILGELLGRTLGYVNIPDAAARDAMIKMGGMAPAWADGLLEMMVMLRSLGRVEPTDAVRRVLGRDASPFRAWAERNVRAFR